MSGVVDAAPPIYRTVLSGKIHRATVTQADLHYVGSLTVDEDLMDASGIVEGEKVQVLDIDNGNRLETYVITGERGSGVIGVNGAAAHLVHPGHLAIIVAYQQVPEVALPDHVARIVHVDARNRVVELGHDPAAPVPGSADQLAGR